MKKDRVPCLSLEAAQVEVLASPVRDALLDAFMTYGPASVNRIGAVMGRDPKSLYYQVRRLVGAGILRQVATQAAGIKKEAIYDATAERYSFDRHLDEPEYRAIVGRTGATIIRNAAGEFEAAMRLPDGASAVERGRLMRVAARLSTEECDELVRLLIAAREYASSHSREDGEHRVTLTTVLVPTEEKA